jgi:hypothetical protein
LNDLNKIQKPKPANVAAFNSTNLTSEDVQVKTNIN